MTSKLQMPSYLGQHTAASIAKESGKWKGIPYLKENEGLLPPNLMVVGDRRRVLSASEHLLERILLHAEVAKRVGPNGIGRVNLAIGIYEHEGKPLPLTILETQMGCSAQDINAWEVLALSRYDGYRLDGADVPAKNLTAIRAGTCGGIIISDDGKNQKEEPRIEIGDVIIGQFSFADAAVIRQRMGCFNSLDPSDRERFLRLWVELGHEMTKDGAWPVIRSSGRAVAHLINSCEDLGLRAHPGGNFTKESLYLESDEDWTKNLRLKYGALSTEMEHFGLAFLTHKLTRMGFPAYNGLVSCVVGTVPGGSFASPGSKEEAKAKESEGLMLEAAMRAMWNLAYTK